MSQTQEQSTPQARGQRVFRLRKIKHLHRKEFCDDGDVNTNTLKGWELGTHGGLTEKGAHRIIKRALEMGIHCSVEWLLYGIGPEPFLIIEHQTEPARTDTSLEQQHIAKELLLFREQGNTFDLLVSDDGMLPFYNQGDYVAGIAAMEFTTCVGRDCIVVLEDDTKLLRMLQKSEKENFYTVACKNLSTSLSKPILYDVKLKAIAPVIWIRKIKPE